MKEHGLIFRAAIYAAIILGSVVMLVPLAWMLCTSLKDFNEVLASPPRWLPAHPQWHNYADALLGTELGGQPLKFNFMRYLLNSVLVTSLVIAGTLVSCTMAAYAFACLRARGRNVMFGLLLSALMLPGQVTIIPLFKLFAQIGWINTYLPLVVPAWLGGHIFGIFLLRQFFRTIPADYVDAARIDASELRILWSIFVPLSKPALLTITVFTFIGSWNDLLGPLIYLQDERLYTMPIGLLNFIGLIGQPEGTPWHLIMAVATMMMAPVVVVFFLAQRKFIEGIAITGLKA